ncbi:putative Family 93 glycoside hydrolase [Seiridium cardinale]|uniref:Family 93 glycoside hydrolase n=1 Tax=Seiridium cardinale TaxID=138064 RepID=A0ABR2Y922_9PEZI
MPKGTILAAANSIPTDLSKSEIDIYASTNGGVAWLFISSVATGAVAKPMNGWVDACLGVIANASDINLFLAPKCGIAWSSTTDDVHNTSNYAARLGISAIAKLPNGTIVLSAGNNGKVFINRKPGDVGAWIEYATPQPAVYSGGLALLSSDDAALVIIGAGALPPSSTNQVSVSVVDLKALIGA